MWCKKNMCLITKFIYSTELEDLSFLFFLFFFTIGGHRFKTSETPRKINMSHMTDHEL